MLENKIQQARIEEEGLKGLAETILLFEEDFRYSPEENHLIRAIMRDKISIDENSSSDFSEDRKNFISKENKNKLKGDVASSSGLALPVAIAASFASSVALTGGASLSVLPAVAVIGAAGLIAKKIRERVSGKRFDSVKQYGINEVESSTRKISNIARQALETGNYNTLSKELSDKNMSSIVGAIQKHKDKKANPAQVSRSTPEFS